MSITKSIAECIFWVSRMAIKLLFSSYIVDKNENIKRIKKQDSSVRASCQKGSSQQEGYHQRETYQNVGQERGSGACKSLYKRFAGTKSYKKESDIFKHDL